MPELLRIPMTGGVNLLADPRNIRDDELVRAGNLLPINPGTLRTRGAVTNVVQFPGSFPTGYTPLTANFGPWVDSPIFFTYYTPWALGIPATVTVIASDLQGALMPSFSPVILSLPSGDDVVRPWRFQFGGRLYFVPGATSSAVAYSIGRGENALTSFAFSGTGNADIRPRLAVPYRNRLAWGNFGPGYENTIVFSDNFAPGTVGNDVLASNGRNVSLVAAGDGDEIVAMVPVMLTGVGSPVDSALLVLRRYSAFLLTGEPDQTTGGTNSLVVNQMSVTTGCASRDAVVSTPYGVIWPSQDEVWLFHSGQLPQPIATKIRPALSNTSRALGIKLSASYHNGFYRLSLYRDGQTATFTEGPQDQWLLDLRDGPPQNSESAKWWGPQQYNYPASSSTTVGGFNIFVRDDRPGGTATLYGIELAWNSALSQRNLVLVSYDGDASADIPMPTGKIAFEADTTIKPDLITKEYDLGDPMLQKIYDGSEANIWASNMGRLSFRGILDGGYQTATVNQDVDVHGFELGVDTLDGTAMPRAPQAVATFDPNRAMGTTVQLRVQGQSGYLIDGTNNEFAFIDNNAAEDDPAFGVAQITAGFYTSLNALLTELAAKMDAAVTPFVGHTATHSASAGLVTIGGVNDKLTLLFTANTAQTSATTTQMEKTRRLGAMLGFDTSANASAVSPPDVVGVGTVFVYATPILELNGLGMRLEVIPRRPV